MWTTILVSDSWHAGKNELFSSTVYPVLELHGAQILPLVGIGYALEICPFFYSGKRG